MVSSSSGSGGGRKLNTVNMNKKQKKVMVISNEKARNSTFKKRTAGLKKKTFELSTLCDVDSCIIAYGPQGQTEIFPDDPRRLRQIIQRYQLVNVDERRKRAVDLSYIMFDDPNHQKKLDQATAEFPEWDERLDHMSDDQLRQILSTVASKTKEINSQIKLLNSKQQSSCIMEGPSPPPPMVGDYTSTQALKLDHHTPSCSYTHNAQNPQLQPLHMMQRQPLDHNNMMMPLQGMEYPLDPTMFCGPSNPINLCSSSSMNPPPMVPDTYNMGNQFYPSVIPAEMEFGNQGQSMFQSSQFEESMSTYMLGTSDSFLTPTSVILPDIISEFRFPVNV